MYDIERLNKIIKDIEKYFSDLKEIGLTKDNLDDPKFFYSSSMVLFGILNRTIDLATEIIVKNEFGMPTSYEQYFELLSNEGIIGKPLSRELRQLMRDRNIFAHEYYNLNKKQVLDISKRIHAVKDFLEKIKELVRKSKNV